MTTIKLKKAEKVLIFNIIPKIAPLQSPKQSQNF